MHTFIVKRKKKSERSVIPESWGESASCRLACPPAGEHRSVPALPVTLRVFLQVHVQIRIAPPLLHKGDHTTHPLGYIVFFSQCTCCFLISFGILHWRLFNIWAVSIQSPRFSIDVLFTSLPQHTAQTCWTETAWLSSDSAGCHATHLPLHAPLPVPAWGPRS